MGRFLSYYKYTMSILLTTFLLRYLIVTCLKLKYKKMAKSSFLKYFYWL